MAVITHIEYKIICDNCGGDVTEWCPARNKTEAVKIARHDYGKPFKRGSQYCEECENATDMENRKSNFDPEAAVRFMATAKPVHFQDIIDRNKSMT